jgi:hypothetical protein
MEIIMKRALLLSAALALLAFPITTTLSFAKDAAKEGEMCDGIAAIQCDKGMFCEHPAGECGIGADRSGKCEKKPGACTEEGPDKKQFAPVCACGGKNFPSDCERKAAGAQKDHDGPCKPDKPAE